MGAASDPRGLLLRHGRSSEQQLRQPSLGHGAEEIHHRQGAAPVVASPRRAALLVVQSLPENGSSAPPGGPRNRRGPLKGGRVCDLDALSRCPSSVPSSCPMPVVSPVFLSDARVIAAYLIFLD